MANQLERAKAQIVELENIQTTFAEQTADAVATVQALKFTPNTTGYGRTAKGFANKIAKAYNSAIDRCVRDMKNAINGKTDEPVITVSDDELQVTGDMDNISVIVEPKAKKARK